MSAEGAAGARAALGATPAAPGSWRCAISALRSIVSPLPYTLREWNRITVAHLPAGKCATVIRFAYSALYATERHGSRTRTAIGIWNVNVRERFLGAETVGGLGVQRIGSPECVAGTDARGLTAVARLTLCGTTHTHTRASLYAAGQHARVAAVRDLPCRESLKGILSAQEVTGTPARVGRTLAYTPAAAGARPAPEMPQEGGRPAMEWGSCDFINIA
ncbi:hypothetical protein EVAR_22237_1 [Eumeta japonica]|uniref:Uncharacterized protein n=1 Tax=Eumeta variegata TaxID=151549 RepID=A0A4C1UAM9_EUMVA|nr:hypothetical protein EVAR_22237_1 [Eumeta japonica]